jgi:hypothetical protein
VRSQTDVNGVMCPETKPVKTSFLGPCRVRTGMQQCRGVDFLAGEDGYKLGSSGTRKSPLFHLPESGLSTGVYNSDGPAGPQTNKSFEFRELRLSIDIIMEFCVTTLGSLCSKRPDSAHPFKLSTGLHATYPQHLWNQFPWITRVPVSTHTQPLSECRVTLRGHPVSRLP